MLHRYLTYLFFLLLVACSPDPQPVVQEHVSIVGSVLEIQGGREFSQISDSLYHQGLIYVAEGSDASVLALSPDGEIIHQFAGKGQGPGELQSASSLDGQGNHLYVFDDEAYQLSIFQNNGEFVRNLKLNFPGHPRFGVDAQHRIYFSNPTQPSPITVIDNQGQIVRRFGENQPWLHYRADQTHAQWKMLFAVDDRIIAVSECKPFIEVYGQDGELRSFISLEEHPSMTQKLTAVRNLFEEQPKRKQRTVILVFEDATLSGNELYLLAWSRWRGPSNLVLVFDVSTDTPKFVREFELNRQTPDLRGLSASSFCRYADGDLYVFGSETSQLFRFPLGAGIN